MESPAKNILYIYSHHIPDFNITSIFLTSTVDQIKEEITKPQPCIRAQLAWHVSRTFLIIHLLINFSLPSYVLAVISASFITLWVQMIHQLSSPTVARFDLNVTELWLVQENERSQQKRTQMMSEMWNHKNQQCVLILQKVTWEKMFSCALFFFFGNISYTTTINRLLEKVISRFIEKSLAAAFVLLPVFNVNHAVSLCLCHPGCALQAIAYEWLQDTGGKHT